MPRTQSIPAYYITHNINWVFLFVCFFSFVFFLKVIARNSHVFPVARLLCICAVACDLANTTPALRLSCAQGELV